MNRVSWFGVVFVAASTMSGCFMFADDCVSPITAHISLPGSGPAAPIALGQCPRLVEYEGELYTVSDFELTVPESAIHPIGTASGANTTVGALADATVYEIEDVDPAEAIALLRPAELGPERIIVATRGMGGGTMPSDLCPYVHPGEQATVVVDACEGPAGSSAP